MPPPEMPKPISEPEELNSAMLVWLVLVTQTSEERPMATPKGEPRPVPVKGPEAVPPELISVMVLGPPGALVIQALPDWSMAMPSGVLRPPPVKPPLGETFWVLEPLPVSSVTEALPVLTIQMLLPPSTAMPSGCGFRGR